MGLGRGICSFHKLPARFQCPAMREEHGPRSMQSCDGNTNVKCRPKLQIHSNETLGRWFFFLIKEKWKYRFYTFSSERQIYPQCSRFSFIFFALIHTEYLYSRMSLSEKPHLPIIWAVISYLDRSLMIRIKFLGAGSGGEGDWGEWESPRDPLLLLPTVVSQEWVTLCSQLFRFSKKSLKLDLYV